MEIKTRDTGAGYYMSEFRDYYESKCCIAELPSEQGELLIFFTVGDWLDNKPRMMSLSQTQAAALWPLIKRFADTGRLSE